MITLLTILLLGSAPPKTFGETVVGEQSWSRQNLCLRRMTAAIRSLDAALPRFVGQWAYTHSPDSVELALPHRRALGTAYLDLAVRKLRPHARKRTGPWVDEKGSFVLDRRRHGADQGAWIAYSEILTADEGRAFVAIVQPALDYCVTTFDPIVRIERWAPNDDRLHFDLFFL